MSDKNVIQAPPNNDRNVTTNVSSNLTPFPLEPTAVVQTEQPSLETDSPQSDKKDKPNRLDSIASAIPIVVAVLHSKNNSTILCVTIAAVFIVKQIFPTLNASSAEKLVVKIMEILSPSKK